MPCMTDRERHARHDSQRETTGSVWFYFVLQVTHLAQYFDAGSEELAGGGVELCLGVEEGGEMIEEGNAHIVGCFLRGLTVRRLRQFDQRSNGHKIETIKAYENLVERVQYYIFNKIYWIRYQHWGW